MALKEIDLRYIKTGFREFNSVLLLDDYDWVDYHIKAYLTEKEMGRLIIDFNYVATLESTMKVKSINDKCFYIFTYKSDIFEKYFQEYLEREKAASKEKKWFSGEDIITNFYNEVLKNHTGMKCLSYQLPRAFNPDAEYDYVFLDIDGTLSIPCYKIDGKLKPGTTQEDWIELCKENDNMYELCQTPLPLSNLIGRLMAKGTIPHVLSTEALPEAKISKDKFLAAKYPGVFNNTTHYVNSDEEKIQFLKGFIDVLGINPARVLYIDDTFSLVLQASVLGINAHHISEFFETREEDMFKI